MVVRLLLVAGLLAVAAPAPIAFATPDHALPCKMVNDPTTGRLRCASGDGGLGGGDTDASQKGNDTGDGSPTSTGPRLTGQICKSEYNFAVGRCDAMPSGTPQQRAGKTQCLAGAMARYRSCLSRIR